MSDIARPYPPATAPAGFAADTRPESPRPYPPGKELAHNGNADKAVHGKDTAK